MIYNILFECVAHLVNEIDAHILIRWIHLAFTLVYGKEYRLDSGRSLRHYGCYARGSDRQTRYITASVLIILS